MKKAYAFMLEEKCRHTGHKYVKMCLQMKKTEMLKKYSRNMNDFFTLFSKICLLVYNFLKGIIF